MTERYIIASADAVTPTEFMRAFGLTRTLAQKSEDQERSIAWREREDAMAKAPKGPDHYWRRKAYTDAANARFAARCAEIHARYRPVERADLEPKELPNGRYQVAA